MTEQRPKCGHQTTSEAGRGWVCTRDPHPEHPDNHVFVRKDGELW